MVKSFSTPPSAASHDIPCQLLSTAEAKCLFPPYQTVRRPQAEKKIITAKMAEPPAKRARLEGDHEPVEMDTASSPVDDFDDDFYETGQTGNVTGPAGEAVPPACSEAAAAEAPNTASLLLPGLGLLNEPSVQQHRQASNGPSLASDGEVEDGEVSDSEAFYGEEMQTQTQTQTPTALATAAEDAPQHSKPMQSS